MTDIVLAYLSVAVPAATVVYLVFMFMEWVNK